MKGDKKYTWIYMDKNKEWVTIETESNLLA